MNITCVLIENRELSNIREIIFDNHLKFLPKNSNVIFFHSKNYEYIKNNLIGLPIIFVNVDEILINNETNHQVYINKLLLSSSFWNKILEFSEKILMIQPDSKILRVGIEEFIEWDYVGSPWKHSIKGGNGGFSWRNAKVMKEITESYKYDDNWDSVVDDYGDTYKTSFTNEDVFFSYKIESFNGKLAPREVCKKFGCETIFELGTFGYHSIQKYMTGDEIHLIENQYNKNI